MRTIMIVLLLAASAYAGKRSVKDVVTSVQSDDDFVAALADPVHVRGVIFADDKCAERFGHPQDVRGADRKALADCILDMKVVAIDTIGATIPLRTRVGDVTVLVGLELRDDHIVAIGGATQAHGKERNLPTIARTILLSPSAATKAAIERTHDFTAASFKLCLDDTGAVVTVRGLKSTGYPAYDDKLRMTILDTWKYKPYLVNGQPVPVCTAVTFIYTQEQ